jgi:uncharacterized paraquat-inducible protein A
MYSKKCRFKGETMKRNVKNGMKIEQIDICDECQRSNAKFSAVNLLSHKEQVYCTKCKDKLVKGYTIKSVKELKNATV